MMEGKGTNDIRGTPLFEGGSGGTLEVVDMLCSVTEALAQIVRKQAEELERAKVEEAVREDLKRQRDNVDVQMDRLEYRLRRL